MNLLAYCALFCVDWVIYKYSLSRTGFLVIILLLILGILSKIRWVNNFICRISVYIQIIIFMITIVLCTFLKNTELYRILDNLMTGRLYYSVIQLSYLPRLFGRNINVFFDNSYSMMISRYGILLTLIFLYFYYKTAKVSFKFGNTSLSIIFIILSVNFIGESSMPNALINISLLFMAKYFFNEHDYLKPI